MYSFIAGKIDEKTDSSVIIDCNGVGYEIFVTTGTLSSIGGVGDFVKIPTYLLVKEDAMLLFGFQSKNEKNLFLDLISVSGVGAKTAISILSGISASDLVSAIAFGDSSPIAKIKGIGKKTADRIILELKGSISNLDLNLSSNSSQSPNNAEFEDAVVLLSTMGLSKMDSLKLVNDVYEIGDKTEDIVSKALKNMNR